MRAAADAAISAQQYRQAGTAYDAIARTDFWPHDADFYLAAVLYAVAGDRDAAFARLDGALRAGYRREDELTSDSHLEALHADSRWNHVVERTRANASLFRRQHANPARVPLVTDDIRLFVDMLPLVHAAATRAEKIAIIEREYLRKGTNALRDFYRVHKIDSVGALLGAIERYPHYYASLGEVRRVLDAKAPEIRGLYAKFKALYPEAYFPPTYFVVGHDKSGGTATQQGAIVGTEVFGVIPGTPLDEIPERNRQFYHPLDEAFQGTIHELVHTQQHLTSSPTLLTDALVEGGAEFIANLVSPAKVEPAYRVWGRAHASMVWERFQREMDGTDVSNWIGNSDRGTPQSQPIMGYYVGFEIAKAYYDHSADKRLAVRTIIDLTDPHAILRDSHYGEQFAP